jgi:GYF domain
LNQKAITSMSVFQSCCHIVLKFVLGPFRPSEMAEWFNAGYFNQNLLVKHGSDAGFIQLGWLNFFHVFCLLL